MKKGSLKWDVGLAVVALVSLILTFVVGVLMSALPPGEARYGYALNLAVFQVVFLVCIWKTDWRSLWAFAFRRQ